MTVRTSPVDRRFPTTNQTKHCWARYLEFHACAAAKDASDPECAKFKRWYRSLCPEEWVRFCSSAFPPPAWFSCFLGLCALVLVSDVLVVAGRCGPMWLLVWLHVRLLWRICSGRWDCVPFLVHKRLVRCCWCALAFGCFFRDVNKSSGYLHLFRYIHRMLSLVVPCLSLFGVCLCCVARGVRLLSSQVEKWDTLREEGRFPGPE